MKPEEIRNAFERHEDEYGEFERIEQKRASHKDVHAFLLLEELVPGNGGNIINSTTHDEIHLEVTLEDLAGSAVTEDAIRDLVRCGIRISEYDGLSMFV